MKIGLPHRSDEGWGDMSQPSPGRQSTAGTLPSQSEYKMPIAFVGRRKPPAYAFPIVSTPLLSSLNSRKSLPKITTVVAPPGYGKTVLLSQLFQIYRKQEVGCLWIPLDERDSSLASLLRAVENELNLEPPVPLLHESFDTPDPAVRIERIRDRLSKTATPLIIFFDNIDFCLDTGVDRLINTLVFNSSELVKLVVSSSSGPIPFNSGRAQLELNLDSIRAIDLTFDRKAAADLFALAGIPDLNSTDLDAVMERTEGWPAAVRLYQLATDREALGDTKLTFARTGEEQISDILSQRLMSSFEPELVRFLHELSELREFSSDLAIVATGSARASFWIQFLVDHNIMVIPIDQKPHWYRFHTLFRQYLVHDAQRHLPPSRRNEVHTAAARWLMKRGELKSAFELALNGPDLDLLPEILESASWLLVHEQGDTRTFINWVERTDRVGIRRGEHATFWYVWALLFERRFAEAKDEVRTAFANVNTLHPQSHSKTFFAKLGLAEILAGVHLDMNGATEAGSQEWLATNPDGEPFDVSAAASAFALARLVAHDFTAANGAVRLAHSAIARSNSIYGRCWTEVASSLLSLRQGDPAWVAREMLDLEQRARASISPLTGVLAVVAVIRARALLELGQTEEAERIVSENLRRAVGYGIPDSTWAGLEVIITPTLRGESDFTLDELREIVKEYPKRIGILFEFALIREYLILDRKEEAFARAEDLGWTLKDLWGDILLQDASAMERSAARIAAIELLIAAGYLQRAGELTQDELREAQEQGRRCHQIDLHLLNADIHLRSNARAGALRSFTRAVATSARREMYAPFLKRRALVQHLLENMRLKELGLTNLEDFTALSQILKLASIEPSSSRNEDTHEGLIDPPTPRELELLHLLETGLDNAQIAERLSVSVRTVKWHLSNLYLKLGVKNRSSAVAKGRSLRLVQQ